MQKTSDITLSPGTSATYLPPLKALTAPWINRLLEDPERIRRQMDEHGSPLNIHCLEPFARNYREYAEVFEDHQLRHLVLFARKANKCQAFVEAASRLGFGVDTASFRELQQCLQLGCDPQRLVYTAAIKDRRSVYLAVQHGVSIILDNVDECMLVKQVAEDLGKPAVVGLRISGFHVDGKKLYSRFGFDIDKVESVIRRVFPTEKSRQLMDYRGLHFHLDGYSSNQRGVAMHAAMDLAFKLQNYQLNTQFIDIGGGLLMNYLEKQSQLEAFEKSLKLALREERLPLTFNNDGLGYEMIDGELHGKLKVYPYFNHNPRSVFLNDILNVTNSAGVSVSARARAMDLEVRMEPGRSLLDQTGVTVARVAHRKVDSRGDLLVGLEMNMTQMYSSSADFLLDPIVINQNKKPGQKGIGAYFTGAYCLERDVLLKRKIQLDQIPSVGDLVVFLNTAGYMMHFFESEAHLFELASNLVFDVKRESFTLDGDASLA
ncbi:type III PLP-dependent enzyme domain-containing protein [Flavilitoribacter nigricans]|uniref:Diaminopimelate decarboxylase n=1 Tax=Flavilitoribacter nigricans (strain ATCC 23147 / DSM 23189 / NBRC 102662 / NCIMB 1420 / SS-2) TaxID=1122177 RepID=A0A2D0NB55_FLAN2|nr:diaminopimelate decarboxylase [Flavilitoribacter nigricans]PHN05717.1 diaminopimelate decarboxylase [Flavilitoribacter nigricans DSM 23189 = NBRC 102662]